MCVLIFSTTFVWNIFHSKKIWARYDQKCIFVFRSSSRRSCPFLIKDRPGFVEQNYETGTASLSSRQSAVTVAFCALHSNIAESYNTKNVKLTLVFFFSRASKAQEKQR